MVTLTIFLGPVTLGLIGTWLPAFGYLPVLNLHEFSLAPWQQLFSYPGFGSSLSRTLFTGIGASVLSLIFLLVILIGLYPSKFFSRIERSLSPVLSVPHAAFAIGLGLLITPSGWLVRFAENLTGLLPQPPLWTSFQDPLGLSLILALTAKELPFLIFMALAVLPSLKVEKTLWLGRSLGYSTRYTWCVLLLPQLYKQIRLPFYAVIAYSLTVVDIALIAGPTTPPTLAVLITQLFNDPNLIQRTVGAAGASLLLLLVIAALLLCFLTEKLFTQLRNINLSHRYLDQTFLNFEKPFALFSSLVLVILYAGSLGATLLWSFTQRWRYPNLWPEQFSLRAWQRILSRIDEPFWCTFWLASLSALIALLLVILALENEVRLQRNNKQFDPNKITWLIYLPLLVPQIAFIFGFQITLIQWRMDGEFLALLWAHLVFVLPYVFLTLSGPYRRYDQRYSWQAIMLTQNRFHSFLKIKMVLLLRPILYALATGFAVSIAQYIPTIFIGAGRFSTLTTEAVAMAAGSDYRMMAVLAVMQQSLPLIVFALATTIPAIRFRKHRIMKQH